MRSAQLLADVRCWLRGKERRHVDGSGFHDGWGWMGSGAIGMGLIWIVVIVVLALLLRGLWPDRGARTG